MELKAIMYKKNTLTPKLNHFPAKNHSKENKLKRAVILMIMLLFMAVFPDLVYMISLSKGLSFQL